MQSYQFFLRMVLISLSIIYKLSEAYPAIPVQRYNTNSPRLSVVEWDQYNERDVQGPDTYAFGYDVQNPDTDDVHFRHEERLANGTVVGSYGYVTPDGNAHVVRYIADERGYRATVESGRRLNDVKPIRVDVDQALADELATAELALQNDDLANVAKFDSGSKKYITQRIKPQRYNNNNNVNINNRREHAYAVSNNLAQAVPVNGNYYKWNY